MDYGYARVSSNHQTLDLQVETLVQKGLSIKNIVSEIVSSKKSIDNRPGLDRLLKKVKSGDTITVTSLDRISRTTLEGLTILSDLRKRGVTVVSLRGEVPDILTSSDSRSDAMIAELLLSVCMFVAEMERERISQRTMHGMDKYFSHPSRMYGTAKTPESNPKLSPENCIAAAQLAISTNITVLQAIHEMGIFPPLKRVKDFDHDENVFYHRANWWKGNLKKKGEKSPLYRRMIAQPTLYSA